MLDPVFSYRFMVRFRSLFMSSVSPLSLIQASNLLETLIWKSPKRNLHEDVVFNLCTIYELETSRALQKKQKLLDLVCRHCGDGFNVQSLKLS